MNALSERQMTAVLSKTDTLAGLPAAWPEDLLPAIQARVGTEGRKIVVLDDDPTGTQTVHDVPVLTTWSEEAIAQELQGHADTFYILTNSRSLTAADAQALGHEIGANLKRAGQRTGVAVDVISRSDSTLRGHFPGEVDALQQGLDATALPCLLVPFFLEGGRYTIADVHYVAEGDRLAPAAQTPYARDAAFGYRHSNLRDWVTEKTGGAVSGSQVVSVTIEDIRRGGPDQVAERLKSLPSGSCCVVNALEYSDLAVFVAGLLAAEAQGCRFVFRSAASFVRERAGVAASDLLAGTELNVNNGNGGLFVVGSYVPKTTAQLAALRTQDEVVGIEVKVDELLNDARQSAAIAAAIAAADRALEMGRDAVLFTSRDLVAGNDMAGSLEIGRRVSDSLVAVVRGIACQPGYLVAKGGITSSDVATKGLGVRRAMIMGQVLPGVPVWRLGQETRWPGMAYIVFPGNVGDDDALADIRQRLSLQTASQSDHF